MTGKTGDRSPLSKLKRPLLAGEAAPQKMIADVFPVGCLSVVSALQGTGKSLLMQKFCNDLSLGGNVLDGVFYSDRPQKSLYLVGELPRATVESRQFTAGWEHDPRFLSMYYRQDAIRADMPMSLDDAEGFKNIAALVDDEKPDLVIFDSLMSFNDWANESDQRSMQPMFQRLMTLAAEKNCAVVVVHHIRKRKHIERMAGIHLDDIVGSGIITRCAAVVLGAETQSLSDGQEWVYVSNLKSWFAPLEAFAFKVKQDGSRTFRGIEVKLDPVKQGTSKTELIQSTVFSGYGNGEPFTLKDISTQTGASQTFVQRCLAKWKDQGLVTSEGTARTTTYRVNCVRKVVNS